jgi:hypothetical protein
MAYLEWSIDEDVGIEPVSPLGRVAIKGDTGAVVEDNLILDTFFEAMIDGLSRLETEADASIDTIDEPHELVLHRVGGGVRLEYGGQTVEVNDRVALKRELAGVVGELLNQLDRAAFATGQKPYSHRRLREFLKNSKWH